MQSPPTQTPQHLVVDRSQVLILRDMHDSSNHYSKGDETKHKRFRRSSLYSEKYGPDSCEQKHCDWPGVEEAISSLQIIRGSREDTPERKRHWRCEHVSVRIFNSGKHMPGQHPGNPFKENENEDNEN